MTFISDPPFLRDRQQVLPVLVLERRGQPLELVGVDEAHPVGDLLQAGDLQALPPLDDLDEVGRLEQRLVRAGVEPGHAAAEDLAAELAAVEDTRG